MINKNKKNIILFISLILTIVSGGTYQLIAQNKTPVTINKNNPSKDTKLLTNDNWKGLKLIWKKYSNLQFEGVYNQDDFKKFQELKSLSSKIDAYLNGLEKSKLLTMEEKNYILHLFDARLHYLEYKAGFIKCYDMTMIGFEITKKYDDLENRYDTLEKLFKENKINENTYRVTREKIKEDLTFIQENSHKDNDKKLNDNFIELVTLLNN